MNSNEQLDFMLNTLIKEIEKPIDVPIDFNSKKDLLRALMNIRPPRKISEEFLNIQNQFLQSQNIVANTNFKKGINLWKGDITTLKVDAIVNAANSRLLGCFIPLHNCIDNIIHTKAGIQLRLECKEIMDKQDCEEKVGLAKITKAYNLPSKYVIHTVGPAIPQNAKVTKKDFKLLANCYKSCLELADLYNLKSIAFCCISTGVFNFPQNQAAKIAVETVKNTENNLDSIIFDVFTDEDYFIYKELLKGEL